MKTTYLLRIQEEIKKQLEEIAKEKGISLNALLQIELRKFIDEWQSKNNQ